jgi:HAD superfamily hydrolase (TIGR01662 family)
VTLKAVLFDVDFTLVKPGPDLGPEGYQLLGKRFGLELDPSRYAEARAAAVEAIERHPELDHDEEVWVLFTQRIIEGMGGSKDRSYEAAVEMTRAWEHAHNFELYEDTLPVLEELRAAGLKVGLVSNSARDVREFARHHAVEIDAGLSSFHHGKTKPHESIFRAVLELLEVDASEAVMVGDTVEDDINGALAIGMRAILVDRHGFGPRHDPCIDDLYALPAALGVPRAGA